MARARGPQPEFTNAIASSKRQAELLRKQVIKTIRAVGDAADQGVKLAALTIYQRSQELVPVDTGKLKASGFVQRGGKLTPGAKSFQAPSAGVATDLVREFVYTVGYNAGSLSGNFVIAPQNNKAFYALWIHEGLRPQGAARHKPPTRSKFLEAAVNEKREVLRKLVKANVIKSLKVSPLRGKAFPRV